MALAKWMALARGSVPALVLAALPCGAQAAERDMAPLFDRYRCLACHGLVHRQVGPGFAEIAERYRDDAGAPARLADRIRNGSVGNWGRLIMPRQPQMSGEEAAQLAAWVLARPAKP